jgi:hypothetical protein
LIRKMRKEEKEEWKRLHMRGKVLEGSMGKLRERKTGICRTTKRKIRRRRKLKNMEQDKKNTKYMSRRKSK